MSCGLVLTVQKEKAPQLRAFCTEVGPRLLLSEVMIIFSVTRYAPRPVDTGSVTEGIALWRAGANSGKG